MSLKNSNLIGNDVSSITSKPYFFTAHANEKILLILALSTLVVSCQKANDSLKPNVETVFSKNRKRIESIIKNATSLTIYIRKFHDGSELARLQIQDGKTDMFADSNFIKIKDSYYNQDMLVSFEYNPGYNSLDLYFG